MCDINVDFIARAEANDLQFVQYALDRGADVHFNWDSALRLSVKNGNLEMVTLLMNNGANANGLRAHFAMSMHNRIDGIQMHGYFTSSALSCAAYYGHTAIVKALLERIDTKIDDETALLFSAREGYTEIVTMLLENGIDVHSDNDAALLYSVNGGHLETVVVLLKAGANVNARDGTPLCASAAKGNLVLVAKLLEYGADIHCSGDNILKKIKKCFNEALADILLPHCEEEFYCYFPEEYIKRKIVLTKNARSIHTIKNKI